VYISEGYFGQAPETIHEKAAHLMRLLASEHPYVDGNKRTALAAAAGFYHLNGYEFDVDDEVREILRAFATDADDVDMNRVIEYLETNTAERS
jgi:death-on-curing protein